MAQYYNLSISAAYISAICESIGVPAGEARHIIIDIQMDEPVIVYVEKIVTDRTMRVIADAVTSARVEVKHD